MTHHAIISLASNHEQKENLCEARKALAQIFSSVTFSPELWTEPLGKSYGKFYLNQLAWAETPLDSDALNRRLKELELSLGRTPELRRHGIVPIDLDLLQHDAQRFHLRDWERPYVSRLLATAGANRE